MVDVLSPHVMRLAPLHEAVIPVYVFRIRALHESEVPHQLIRFVAVHCPVYVSGPPEGAEHQACAIHLAVLADRKAPVSGRVVTAGVSVIVRLAHDGVQLLLCYCKHVSTSYPQIHSVVSLYGRSAYV